MDFERTRIQLIKKLQQKLIELNHLLLNFQINHQDIKSDYEMKTDQIRIVLSVYHFPESKGLFDSIRIGDDDDNMLLEFPLNCHHTLDDIYEIFVLFFK